MSFRWRRQAARPFSRASDSQPRTAARRSNERMSRRESSQAADSRARRSCRCEGAPEGTLKKSSTAANPGRRFWVCAKARGQQCGFFEWDDVPSRGEPKEATPNEESSSEEPQAKRPRSAPRYKFKLISMDRLSTTMPASCLKAEDIDNLKTVSGVSVKAGEVDVFGGEILVVEADIAVVEDVVDRIMDFNVRVESDVPFGTLRRLIDFRRKEKLRMESKEPRTSSLTEVLPAGVREKLMDFQWDGVRFAVGHEGRCLIGDDMGLGKTLQAIAVAHIYRDDWPLLVICPSSLRLNWKEELLKWLEDDIREDDINVIMKGSDAKMSLNAVNIVSYELVQKIPEERLESCGFIVADESHYLKSKDSKRTKFIIPLISRARRALLLSGTPALSRPIELFPQVSALEPVLFPNYRLFAERYCNARMSRWGWDVSGASCLDELHTMLSGSCLIRRKKSDVLTQLPPKQRGVVWVETKPSVMREVAMAQREYEAALSAVDNAGEDDAESCRNAMRAAMHKLYGLTGQAKVEAVQQFLKDTLESTSKVIVFCHHQEVLVRINEYLKKSKVETIVIDGKTAPKSRQGLCSKFQTDPTCRAAVLSITAAGVGLTLTAASVVVFAELYWNPGSLLQAEDRAHRIGQMDSVLVRYLLARNTLDESIWRTVRKKLVVVGRSLTGAPLPLNVDDFEEPEDGPIDQFVERASDTKAAARSSGGPIIALDSSDEIEVVEASEESKASGGASAGDSKAACPAVVVDLDNSCPFPVKTTNAVAVGVGEDVVYVDADVEHSEILNPENRNSTDE